MHRGKMWGVKNFNYKNAQLIEKKNQTYMNYFHKIVWYDLKLEITISTQLQLLS